MPTNIQWPPIGGTTYPIPTSGETNWPVLTNFLVALQNAQGTTAQKIAVRIATSSPVTVSSALDCVIAVDLTVPGPATVNLPPIVPNQWLCITDRAGDAATNPITIVPNGSETIAGLTSLDLNQNGASIIIAGDPAGNWVVIAQAAGEGTGGGISRSAIDAGTANWVVINAGTGLLSEEQYLSAVRGGLGVNASSLAGYIKMSGGLATAVSTIAAADLASGIDAAKIGAGSVSNAEFGYLAGVSSAIQTQLNAKQATGNYITALTGDVTASGPGSAAATIANNAVTTAKIADSAVNNAKVSIGIDAQKLSSGAVTNTVFDYLIGASSNIQTQLNGKEPTITTLSIAKGGTGQATANAALNALLPTQTLQATKYLQTDGTNTSWQPAAGGSTPKQYVAGTAYTNGTPTVTSAQGGFTLLRGVLVPYQTSDGAWRLQFNLSCNYSSASISSLTWAISGITVKNVSGSLQACCGLCFSHTQGIRAFAIPNTNTVTTDHATATTSAGMAVSGDIELNGKPTWAD